MVTYAERPWTENYDVGMPTTLEFPEVPLHQFLKDTSAQIPHNTALITPAVLPVLGRVSKSITYAELDRASDALSAALVEQGLKKSDRVAIVMPNSVAFVISFYAILKAGGVVAATNPTYPADKMAHQINDCDAEFVLTMTLFYGLIKQIQPRTKVRDGNRRQHQRVPSASGEISIHNRSGKEGWSLSRPVSKVATTGSRSSCENTMVRSAGRGGWARRLGDFPVHRRNFWRFQGRHVQASGIGSKYAANGRRFGSV